MFKESSLENPDQIPEIDQALLHKIEHGNIDPSEKGNILLVKLGVKPSAWLGFDIKMWNEGEDSHILRTEDDVLDIISIIEGLGLPREIMPRTVFVERQRIAGKPVNVRTDHMEARIASDQKKLDALDKAIASKDHGLIGRALGIPETAVEAFMGKRKKLNPYTLPKEVILSDSFIFTPTRVLSKDNWQNEILEGEKRARILKEVSPEIFQEIKAGMMKSDEGQGFLSDKFRKRWSKKDF